MRINPFVYGILVLVIFMGTIAGFRAAGIWSISGKVTAAGEEITADGTDVNSIKGWMTLESVTKAFNVPLDELLLQFHLPADTSPATPLKDLESDTFDITVLREWLNSRVPKDEPLPGKTPTEPVAVNPTTASTPVIESAPVKAVPTVHVADDRTITGKVTFQQVLDWGVPGDTIEQIIGGPLPAATIIIKDYVTGKGLEFTAVKTALQAEIDRVK